MVTSYGRIELAHLRSNRVERGFLKGLTDVGLPSEVEAELARPFDKDHVLHGVDVPCVWWFTEEGVKHFKDAINKISDVINEKDWYLIGITLDTDAAAEYADEYQVAFRPQAIRGARFESIDNAITDDLLRIVK